MAAKNMQRQQSFRRHALLFALLSAPVACLAQYKCVGSDGKTSFQQMPCADGASSQRLGSGGSPVAAPAGGGAGKGHWSAIARGMPEVGMTRAELDSAVGRADKTAAAQSGTDSDDILTYNKPDKTYEVTLRNGVVTGVNSKDPETTTVTTVTTEPRRSACPTPAQIRDMEFESAKIVNRNNYALRAQINAAKACR